MRVLTFLSLFLVFTCLVQAQEIGTPEYKQAILNGEIEPEPRKEATLPAEYAFFQTATTCQPEDSQGFIPIDFDTWERVAMSADCFGGSLNGWEGDDCSTDEIELDFDYSVCGELFSSLWLNINGNLTFDVPNGVFTPDGIPNDNAVMAAPFWADVELSSACGEIWILNTPSYFIATWLEVGYFNNHCDLLNTFQVVITDGNDPIIGTGNNTGFFYGDMNWTTGDASDGLGGLGGSPAVVGINSGEDDAFAIIGEFDMAGAVYDGPLGLNDGVDFLDNKFYLFNSNNCAIESSCSIFELDVNPTECNGNTYDLVVSFVPAGTGTNGYIVSFNEEVLGPFSYAAAGELTEFIIPDLPGTGQAGITIGVIDLDSPDCATDCFYDAPPCQGCTSDAGTMPPGPVYVCDGGVALSATAGQVLDDNDVLNYALHTSATSTPGDILAVNVSGQFMLGDALTGTSYYISAIVGNDNGDGTVNLNDACLSVAAGTEVVFLNPIQFNITEDCDTEIGDLSVLISPTGGLPEIDGGSYNVSGTALVGVAIDFGTQAIVSLGSSDGQSYSFTASDANGCSGSFQSDLVSCLKTPIELTSFTARAETNVNLIQWTTGTELDNAYFELHHSSNGTDFSQVARLNGAGTSLTAIDYEFAHKDFPTGFSYYQLNQFDFNGKSSQSNIVSVYQEEEVVGPWTIILNNPVQTTLNVSISSIETLQFNVYDITGRKIFRQGIEEADFIALETDQLDHGVYFLEASNGNRRSIHKFIKH